MDNIIAKFSISGSKIHFKAENLAAKKSVEVKDVKSIDDVLRPMLKELSITIFDIIQLFKDGIARNHIGVNIYKKNKILKFGDFDFNVGDGESLGEVLGEFPDIVVEELESFYWKYFKEEFHVAYLTHLGIA